MAGTSTESLMRTLSKMKHLFLGIALVLVMTWLVPAIEDNEEAVVAMASSLGTYFTRAFDVVKMIKN